MEIEQGRRAIFPHLDRILAKAVHGSAQFVRDLVNRPWLTNKEALGDIASVLQKHFDKCVHDKKWEGLTADAIAVHKLDALLTLAQFSEGRSCCTLWIGCPTIPIQLLSAVQLRMKSFLGEGWLCPEVDDTVEIIGRIDNVAREARTIAQHVRTKQTVDWTAVHRTINDHRHHRTEAQLLGSWDWKALCRAADREEVDSLVSFMQEQLNEHSTVRRPSNGIPSEAEGDRPTFVLRAEPKEGRPKLSEADTERLNVYLKSDSTGEIDISQARLLTEASGTELCSLQPGGSDLAPVALSEILKDFILAVRQELCLESSLRSIPAVALTKVLTMRLMPSDNFILEHFSYVSFRDPTTGPKKMTKVKGLYRDMYALQASKDYWAPIETIDDLGSVMEGLEIAVWRMLHSSLISGEEVAALWAQTKAIWVQHGGRARIVTLTEAIRVRLEEHVQAIRRAASVGTHTVPSM